MQTTELKTLKQRNYSIDLIKIVASCLVIIVHFFLNTNYYNLSLKGGEMFLFTCIRNFAMCCVPLFLLATGYLMCGKELKKGYYFGICRTILIFLIAEIGCCLFDSIVTDNVSFFKQILRIGSIHYSWYIDMYIGLFIIIPFLNTAYRKLNSQKEKRLLVLSFAAITMIIPSIFVTVGLSQGWWTKVYPLAYYYIGCHIKENENSIKSKIKAPYCMIGAILTTVLLTVIIFLRLQGGVLSSISGLTSYSSFFICVSAVMIFLMILKLQDKLENTKIIKSVLCKLSRLTLGAYLISYIADEMVYDIVYNQINVDENRFVTFPIIVPLVILSSFCMSYLINIIADGIMFAVNKLKKA